MTDAPGVVTSVDGSHAVVRMDEAGCGRCHEPGGCGGQNIGKMFDSQPRQFCIENSAGANVGDRVTVTVEESLVHRSALFAYGLPLLTLFAGAFLGRVLTGEEGSIIGAALGVFIGWRCLPALESLAKERTRTGPHVKC